MLGCFVLGRLALCRFVLCRFVLCQMVFAARAASVDMDIATFVVRRLLFFVPLFLCALPRRLGSKPGVEFLLARHTDVLDALELRLLYLLLFDIGKGRQAATRQARNESQ